MSESTTARVHFVVHPPRGVAIPDVDVTELERQPHRRLALVARRLHRRHDHRVRRGRRVAARPAPSRRRSPRPTRRTSRRPPARSTSAGSSGSARPGPTCRCSPRSTPPAARPGSRSSGAAAPISLSQVLPALSSMGVEVVDERPYQLDHVDHPSYIYEFGLRYAPGMPDHMREAFQDTIRAVWDGYNEIDGFNALVLGARLTWRQATVLRAYAKYMKQGNSPFAVDYIEEALRGNTDITRLLVQLFEARFDPGRNGLGADAEARTARVDEIVTRIERALDDVASLDHDRILRSYLTHIRATLRTNYFQLGDDGKHHAYMSFKLEPSEIPDLPQPRPRFEIFVYSPRVEGVHLRFGAVARGGLRWSDRRDDFRTEVLGLVKAQMVKNTVIVPGRRQGRLLLQAAARPGRPRRVAGRGHRLLQDVHLRAARHHRQPRRRAERAAARASYATTPTTPTSSSPPTRAPRRSPTSPTASPRTTASGSATPSPRVARSATTTRRWASPPAARGSRCSATSASAASTARPRTSPASASATCPATSSATACSAPSTPCWSPPSTTATSSSTRPPTPAASFAERKRMFGLPRSSWQDYDAALISEGGGVYARSLKSIPISPQVRTALGLGDRRHRDDARRADEGDPAGAGRPALERRHRHLREVERRDPRRRRRQGQRRDPDRRPRPAGPVRGGGRQPRAHPARPHRVRPGRRGPARAARSTPTSSTTPPGSTPPTTRSTSRSCSTGSSATAT